MLAFDLEWSEHLWKEIVDVEIRASFCDKRSQVGKQVLICFDVNITRVNNVWGALCGNQFGLIATPNRFYLHVFVRRVELCNQRFECAAPVCIE